MIFNFFKIKKASHKKTRKGFTLIELLVVIAILSILLIIVVVSIDAPRRIRETNNAVRSSNLNSIILAVQQYAIDNKGALPAGLSDTEKQIGTSVDGCVNLKNGCDVLEGSCLDLTESLKDYFTSFPKDPTKGSNSKTAYSISINSKNIVTVKACEAEGEQLVLSN